MGKKIYIEPIIEIIEFEEKDFIVMSSDTVDTEFCELYGQCEDSGEVN